MPGDFEFPPLDFDPPVFFPVDFELPAALDRALVDFAAAGFLAAGFFAVDFAAAGFFAVDFAAADFVLADFVPPLELLERVAGDFAPIDLDLVPAPLDRADFEPPDRERRFFESEVGSTSPTVFATFPATRPTVLPTSPTVLPTSPTIFPALGISRTLPVRTLQPRSRPARGQSIRRAGGVRHGEE